MKTTLAEEAELFEKHNDDAREAGDYAKPLPPRGSGAGLESIAKEAAKATTRLKPAIKKSRRNQKAS